VIETVGDWAAWIVTAFSGACALILLAAVIANAIRGRRRLS
jgi:hypothetical protein